MEENLWRYFTVRVTNEDGTTENHELQCSISEAFEFYDLLLARSYKTIKSIGLEETDKDGEVYEVHDHYDNLTLIAKLIEA